MSAGTLRAQLAHVALRVEDVDALVGFYEDVLGLTTHERLADGRVRLGWGIGHHALELARGRHGLDHFALEVPDLQQLEDVAERLALAGVPADWEAPDGDHPRALVTRDPDGHRVELLGRVERAGEHTADTGRRPIRVQHVTLGSPRRAELVGFYADVLGFRVSDHMGDVFTWLRCGVEHHTVAVVSAERAALDHYSYDVSRWEDFKVWCDELAARDVQVTWGPGRHGPGNNLFVMFPDAAGFRVELSAEMERYWDDRSEQPPRHWEPTARTVNLWGPVPDWRTVA